MARHVPRPVAPLPGLVALLAVSLLSLAACALPGQSVRRVPTATPTQTPSHAPFYVTNSNHLYALDTGTGEVIWQTPTGSSARVINSTHDAVFVEDWLAGDAHSHTLYVYRVSDGMLMANYPGHPYFITDGSVVVADSYGAPIEAFDAMTGARRWKLEIAGWLDDVYFSGSAVVLPIALPFVDLCRSGKWLAPLQIQALDARDGTPRWNIVTSPGNSHSSYVQGDALYWSADEVDARCVATANQLHTTEIATGSSLWTREVDQGFIIQEVAGGTIYGVSPHGIYAYRASDGIQLWRNTAGRNAYLTAMDHAVAVEGESGDLFLDAATGTPLWSVPGFFMALFDSHDGLALGQAPKNDPKNDPRNDPGAGLEARDEVSGTLRWRVTLPRPYPAQLQIIGSVLVATQERWDRCSGLLSNVTVTGLDAATGRILWTRELPEADATPTPSPHLATPAANRAVEMASRC